MLRKLLWNLQNNTSVIALLLYFLVFSIQVLVKLFKFKLMLPKMISCLDFDLLFDFYTFGNSLIFLRSFDFFCKNKEVAVSHKANMCKMLKVSMSASGWILAFSNFQCLSDSLVSLNGFHFIRLNTSSICYTLLCLSLHMESEIANCRYMT